MAFPIEKWIENGVPLGTAGVYFVNDAGEKIANVVGVFVVKEARGRKIGSMLIETVINRLKQEKEIKKVRLNVNKDQETAVEMYKKFGFEVIDEEIEKMGDGQEHSEYLMELNWN